MINLQRRRTNMKKRYEKPEVDVTKKILLTCAEASAISNIGINTIYKLMQDTNNDFVFMIGRKKLVKRKAFTEYLNSRNGNTDKGEEGVKVAKESISSFSLFAYI